MGVLRWLAAVLAALLASSCGGGGGGGGGGSGEAAPSSPGTETTFSVASQQTGLIYPVTVWVPAGYASSASVPAIYALDHELQYAAVRDQVQARGLNAIVVSVGNISPDRRFVDFQLPGAEAYFRFLTRELLPFVEGRYRIDPARRTLAGYSLSGLLATIAFLIDDPFERRFAGFILTDPSLQLNTAETIALELALAATLRRAAVSYYACYTSLNPVLVLLHQLIQSRAYDGMRIQHRFYGLSHGAVLRPCVEDGVRFIFEP